ncbi:bifunctional diaminohydroxyphosphoribosylaminopyrimidine deaminase/5-amino-6-(5-phosphoribosylamino)uracil reductase RibD [Pseudoflavitalea sp. G-6-1-2]|nr:bifunctional diaminohydroxyphosphoribosylaminopyrimidine deaminase/5-amino-6-(5-phosphoribosylamino)uracil reductase RibD [Pseudoflavitalea sp. G-6-1-2]
MQRCLELAVLGAGHVAPNPMVGAVLVHNGRIIGEGYHMKYGEAHAEVNCINSVASEDQHLIGESVIYVSLEPCAHHGKTPPCADLIIRHKIPKVVVGCRDPFPEVDGKGIEKLRAAGIDVIIGVCEEAAKALNKRFFTYHTAWRPYVTLKWAQTADGYIAGIPGERLLISNALTNRFVHQWRSEEASILVGTNTAMQDDPQLNTRYWQGTDPVKLVVDLDLRLPSSLKLFNGNARTIVFNALKHGEEENIFFYEVERRKKLVPQLLQALYKLRLNSVLVEGGAVLLQSFIDAGLWDEARVITNTALTAGTGLPAPQLAQATMVQTEQIQTDIIQVFSRPVATL